VLHLPYLLHNQNGVQSHRTGIVDLDMSVEDGMEMVISAGIVTPPGTAADDAGEAPANAGVVTTP